MKAILALILVEPFDFKRMHNVTGMLTCTWLSWLTQMSQRYVACPDLHCVLTHKRLWTFTLWWLFPASNWQWQGCRVWIVKCVRTKTLTLQWERSIGAFYCPTVKDLMLINLEHIFEPNPLMCSWCSTARLSGLTFPVFSNFVRTHTHTPIPLLPTPHPSEMVRLSLSPPPL